MKRELLLSIACLAVLAACQSEVSSPPFEPGHSARPDFAVAGERISLSVEEGSLIGQLKSIYPPANTDVVGRALSDPFMIGIKTPQNRRAQAIIDQIDVIRRARIDAIVKIQNAKGPTGFPATVVLVQQLSDPTATAVVWRRTHLVPHDVIALQADRATVGALGAGARVLMNLRKAEGDSATTDEHVVVHGEHVPKQWQGDMSALANGELYQLRQSAVTSIPSFGTVRSRTIWLTPAKAAKSK